MPKRSYDDFAAVIAGYQAPPSDAALTDLIAGTIALDPDDVDEEMTGFARSRIALAYRTGDVATHLRHLYDVLTTVEQRLGQA